MVKLICSNYGFRYQPKTNKQDIPSICGNCGKIGTVSIEPDASALIDSVDMQ